MTPHVSTALLRTQTDERLVRLTTLGHDRAFEAIVDRYRRPLLRYATRMLSETRAEDVVQAAFVSAWGAMRDGTEVRDLRPWLYRIVHNGALNAMKKPGSDDAPLTEASAAAVSGALAGPHSEVEQREDMRQLLDGIAALPDRQRAALLAVAFEGRSHLDIGAELGLNETAARQLVRRARTSLRTAATAIVPFPAAVWFATAGGSAAGVETASRIGELVGGSAAGSALGVGALKAGAIVATAGALAVGGPQVVQVVQPSAHRASHTSTRGATKTSGTGSPRVAPTVSTQLTAQRLRSGPPASGLGGTGSRSGSFELADGGPGSSGVSRGSGSSGEDHGGTRAPGTSGGESHRGSSGGQDRQGTSEGGDHQVTSDGRTGGRSHSGSGSGEDNTVRRSSTAGDDGSPSGPTGPEDGAGSGSGSGSGSPDGSVSGDGSGGSGSSGSKDGTTTPTTGDHAVTEDPAHTP